jgi:glycerophosphoryl diester phosphodiesterase
VIIALAVLLVLIIVAVIYLFLIMPRITDRADMDLVSTDYAHRGLWDSLNPENSVAAAMLAVKYGYGIELDVHLSKDGHVMVFHDAMLTRMCGVEKCISDCTLAELKTYRLAETQHTIPTFDELLEAVGGKVPLLIEIKGDAKDEDLCRAVAERLDTYDGAFAIQSFNPYHLAWFKNYRPRFARGQLVAAFKKKNKRRPFKKLILAMLLTNVLSRPDFISVHLGHMKSLSFRLCVALFKCKAFVWTARADGDYKIIHRLGLFAIFEKIRP